MNRLDGYASTVQARADACACEGAERRPMGRPSDLAGVWGGAPRKMIGGFGDGWLARGFPVTADSAPEEKYENLAKK